MSERHGLPKNDREVRTLKEDYVTEENSVRVIDVFVEQLDLDGPAPARGPRARTLDTLPSVRTRQARSTHPLDLTCDEASKLNPLPSNNRQA